MLSRQHTILILWTTFTLISCTYTSPVEISSNKTELGEYSDKSSEKHAKKLGKKKAHTIPNKSSSPTSFLDDENLFEPLETHPAGFDFNLDDLEDIHENFKKGDLNDSEEQLLRDVEATTVSTTVPDLISRTFFGSNDSQHHVYKVAKSPKQKTKSFDVAGSKTDEFHKYSGTRLNSFESVDFNMANMSGAVGNSSEHIFPILIGLYNHYNWQPVEIRSKVSAACGVEFYAYLSALNNNVEWAQRAFDSSGRYRGQYLYGNDLWQGEKMFCYEVNHRMDQSEREKFAFGFYMARVSIRNVSDLTQSKTLHLGECLPKSCNPKDVQVILELDPHAKMLKGDSTGTELQVEILNVRRVPGDYNIWNDRIFYILSSVVVLIMVISIISTIYESKIESFHSRNEGKLTEPHQDHDNGKGFELFQIQTTADNVKNNNNNNSNVGMEQNSKNSTVPESDICKKKLKTPCQLLLCFSLARNAKLILTTTNSNEKLLSSTHGMRVLSLLWTILVHTYIFIYNVGENRYRRAITERSFTFQIIPNATFSVDTFFFISGLLVTYLFLKYDKPSEKTTYAFAKKGTLEGVIMLTYRYIRLTPAYLFVVFFNRIAMEFVLNGSVFTPYPIDYPSCRKYWWRNVLYVNNWYSFHEFCMHWSWYLANDMQFYIMAAILLIVSRRYFKFSTTILLIFLCTSWATSGIVSLHSNYVYNITKPFASFDILYDKPWQRVGPYIVGMITGYIIHRVKTPPRVPFVVNLSMWLCMLAVFSALVFGVWNGQLGLLSTAFYVGIGHTAWAVGLVWITLSCCWGLCRPLNKLLSYSGFLPLSRLTYCTYLIHPIVIAIVTYQMEGPMNLQHPMILTMYLGYTILSFFAGFMISLLFEAPTIRILKILFHR